MPQALVSKLEQRGPLSAEDIVREGECPSESSLMLEGLSARYKILSNGRRQITALHVLGDFVDLHSFLLKKMDHGVVALTPCRIGVVPHDELRAITDRYPNLTRLLWLNTLIDGAIHREWLVAMGRRSALGHTAHLICELFLRLEAVGRTQGNSMNLPITQAELGDTLGISTVHVNRVVQELRSQGLITWRGEKLTIDNWDGLRAAAEFDPTYIHLGRQV